MSKMWVLGVTGAMVAVSGAANGQNIIMSLTNGASIYGTGHQDTELMLVDPVNMTASIFFDNDDWDTNGANDINAFSMLPNGNLLISVLSNATLGGVSFSDDEVIEYNPNTGVTTSFFDFNGLLSGASDGDIDAFHVNPDGTFLFSVLNDQTFTYGSSTVNIDREDLVLVDPVNMTASMFFDGSAVATFSALDQVSSASIDDQGRLVLSQGGAGTTTLGGLTFGRGDLVAYDMVNDLAELLIDASTNIYSGNTEDINANHWLVPTPGSSVVLLGAAGAALRRRRS